MLKRLTICPLGSDCEKIVGDTVHTCAWYLSVKGTDPQTGEQVEQKSCAVVAQAMLQMDTTKAVYGQITAQTNLAKVILHGKEELINNQSDSQHRLT
jgi:hypothetical protein